jgi:hypothetical protein
MRIIVQSLDFDILMILLCLVPLIGGFLSALTGKSDGIRNRILRHAALFSDIAAFAVMALIVYRRFHLPLGAMQLFVDWGNWFSVEPLTAGITLRMDTEAGILCGIVIIGTLLLQIRNTIVGRDPRIRGASSVILAACLLFILADNLIPVIAALAAIGPLIAIAGMRSGDESEIGNRSARILLTHGFGNAFALLGLFCIFGALGTLQYERIAALAVARPPSINEAMFGAVILLLGVGLRTGPGLLNAICPFSATIYLSYRLADLVGLIPVWIFAVCVIALGGWCIANIAYSVFDPQKTRWRLPSFSKSLRVGVASFFDQYLDQRVFRSGAHEIIKIPLYIGKLMATWTTTPRGWMGIAAVGVMIAMSVYFTVGH